MTTGLTTLDGFPRSDIDVAQGRAPARQTRCGFVADEAQCALRGRASSG